LRFPAQERAQFSTVTGIEPLEGVTFPEGAKVIVTLLTEEDEPQFWLSASETSLAEVWENDEDNIYAELLQG